MLTGSNEIPLLPLPAVLFPGTFLPVQIVEARHQELLHACAADHQHLGVILTPGKIGGHSPAACTVGCVASVTLLLDSEEDQSSNVVLYGEQRMRVMEFTRQDPYSKGCIEMLEEYPGLHAERRTKQASTLFQRYLELIRHRYQAQVTNLPLPDDPVMASYLLAAVLFLPLETKQRWLESASAALRLQEELAYLHAECDKITTILALSHHTQHSYAVPDMQLFANFISPN